MSKKKNKSSHELVLVQADDWEGLYIDGKIDCQGHEIGRFYLFDVVLKYQTVPKVLFPTAKFENQLNEEGYLPKLLSECDLEEA